MSTDVIFMELSLIEEYHLARLIDDFIELVSTAQGSDDPALARLTPTAYPDDPDAAAQFAGTTQNDLYDRRIADARNVRAKLGEFNQDIDARIQEAALSTREVLIAPGSIDAWLRTMTAIRLVIATRLGITSDNKSGGNGRHDAYDWLGYRLEMLVQAADER